MALHPSGYMKLAVIDEIIVDCRLRGIYRMMKNGNHKKAMFMVLDTIVDLREASVEMEIHMYDHVLAEFLCILMALGFKKYDVVHNLVRDLHFHIIVA